MQLSLADVVRATGARVTGKSPGVSLDELRFKGWSIDSRSVTPGDLFFAIRGERFDGHGFLRAAFEAGAAAAVVSQEVQLEPGILLHIDDSVSALGVLARAARERWNRPLVAITGSAGKTTTKEIVAALLGTRFKIGKTAGNLNNHLGLPLTLLRLPEDAELAVVEMGMNHAGEIRHLAALARPEIGVVTNVGYAHVEAFDDIGGVALAKRELVESLPRDGTAILNADDERVAGFAAHTRARVLTYGVGAGAEVRGEQVETGPHGSRFQVHGVVFETSLTGAHAVSNILAALAVASVFGIDPGELAAAVRELTPGNMRGVRRQMRGVTIIDDSYNSNPEAARAMLAVLASEPARRRIAVLGEMLELGAWSERLHRQLGRAAVENGIDILIGVGGAAYSMIEAAREAGLAGQSALFFGDSESAGEFLRSLVRTGDAVLFKGSRGTHVERALARMEQ